MIRSLALMLQWALVLVAVLWGLVGGAPEPVEASPGICVGPVCGDQFSLSSTYPWQLRLRVSDQQGRHERLLIDCRNGVVSPLQGPVERGYAVAVARRACRFSAATT